MHPASPLVPQPVNFVTEPPVLAILPIEGISLTDAHGWMKFGAPLRGARCLLTSWRLSAMSLLGVGEGKAQNARWADASQPT